MNHDLQIPLACTVRGCGRPLLAEGQALRCERKHNFDRAREGYWNLLQPQDRRSARPGDSPEAIGARRRWLERGFAGTLVDEIGLLLDAAGLARSSDEAPADTGLPPIVIDVGCGEGTLLQRACARRRARLCGVDISAPALGLAARSDRAITWVVANADRGLPFLDGSADLLLSFFGRCNGTEIRRVLRPTGRLLVAVPGEDDLIELREAVQGEGRLRDRVPELLSSLGVAAPDASSRTTPSEPGAGAATSAAPRGARAASDPLAGRFALVAHRTWRARAEQDSRALRELLAMTYRGQRSTEQRRLAALDRLTVTLSADLLLLAAS